MLPETIITKLFNCIWSNRNKTAPAESVDITVYDHPKDGELVLFELFKRSKHITHITLSKKQLRTILQLNEVIKHTPQEPTTKSQMLPDAKGRPASGGITCGLNRPR